MREAVGCDETAKGKTANGKNDNFTEGRDRSELFV
jgi:hypothetical protein